MEAEFFSKKPVVTGVKQTRRAIMDDRAAEVYLASDADDKLLAPLRELCAQKSVPVAVGGTMEQLGQAAGIAVGAAACAVLNSA